MITDSIARKKSAGKAHPAPPLDSVALAPARPVAPLVSRLDDRSRRRSYYRALGHFLSGFTPGIALPMSVPAEKAKT